MAASAVNVDDQSELVSSDRLVGTCCLELQLGDLLLGIVDYEICGWDAVPARVEYVFEQASYFLAILVERETNDCDRCVGVCLWWSVDKVGITRL